MSKLSDREKIIVLLQDERLAENERAAFQDMLEKLETRYDNLTQPMRIWVDAVFLRLEKDAEEGAQNLYSSGLVPDGLRHKNEPLKKAYETMARPTRPPGR